MNFTTQGNGVAIEVTSIEIISRIVGSQGVDTIRIATRQLPAEQPKRFNKQEPRQVAGMAEIWQD